MRANRLRERIIVTGRVIDEYGHTVRNTLVEIWQANAAGRDIHQKHQHPEPLDPNFLYRTRSYQRNFLVPSLSVLR